VEADALPPITVKGISRPVVPYVVRRLAEVPEAGVIHGQAQGLDLFLDVTALDAGSAGETRRLLEQALTALDTRAGQERPRAM
jgi:adenylate cyclase